MINRSFTITVGLRRGSKSMIQLEHEEIDAQDFKDEAELCDAIASHLYDALQGREAYLLTVQSKGEDVPAKTHEQVRS